MIQLSNLLATSLETPVKPTAAGALDAGFAKMFAGELEGEAATGGKILPVGSESLPVALPDALPVKPDASAAMADEAVKLPVAGKVLLQDGLPALADEALSMADGPDPKSEPPRLDNTPIVASKAIAAELKVRIRADRSVPQEAADKPVEAEADNDPVPPVATKGDADSKPVKTAAKTTAKDSGNEAVEQTPAVAIEMLPDTQTLPLVAVQVAISEQSAEAAKNPVETDGEDSPAPRHAETSRSEAKQADVRLPATRQAETPILPVRADQQPAARDDAQQADARETSRQNAGTRLQSAAPEFRFELTKDTSEARPRDAVDTRLDRAAGSQARMPLPLAAQIATPEQGALHGQLGDVSASATSTPQTAALAAPSQPQRPQDFTALVDRLVEARETARAGSVNVAVMHADFGQVSLRFSHDAGGLSVSMSNSDPEFARAVGAATQADGAQNGDASAQGGRRDDGGQNAGLFSRSGTTAGGGQASADANATGGGRQQAQHDPRSERAAAQARTPAKDDRADRDGIYA